jgi:serine/threonine protein kinase
MIEMELAMPTINQRISEYVLEQRIGGGTFGEVWRAHHHIWADQCVAVKIPTDPQYVRNLQREGAAIHGLVHPNIVRAIGFDPYADPPYLVMEYVPGVNLRSIIQERKTSPQATVAIMRQVAAGLAYAHAHGVIHRDVKPENILLHERAFTEGFNADGVVKVTDFGLGKATTATVTGASIAYSQSLNSTEGHGIAGTLDYMSPETRGGAEIDARSDIYACGVILYELLTGERPAGTEVPSDLNPAVPQYLDEVFRKSYARLDKRYASAGDFGKALALIGPPPLPPHAAAIGPAAVGPAGAKAPRTQCPQCHQPVHPGDQFCMLCGMQLVDKIRRCHKCGAYPDPLDKFCMLCGASLVEETTTA